MQEYFDNKGKCPNCLETMIIHVGCVNRKCKVCKEHRIYSEEFDNMMKRFERNTERVGILNDQYREARKDRVRRQNLDNAVKKTYNNDILDR